MDLRVLLVPTGLLSLVVPLAQVHLDHLVNHVRPNRLCPLLVQEDHRLHLYHLCQDLPLNHEGLERLLIRVLLEYLVYPKDLEVPFHLVVLDLLQVLVLLEGLLDPIVLVVLYLLYHLFHLLDQ